LSSNQLPPENIKLVVGQFQEPPPTYTKNAREKEMYISARPHFKLGSLSFWASIPEPTSHELLHHYTTRAQVLLAGCQKCLPDDDRLQLIVQAAMEARALFFVATMTEPTTEDLDVYFDNFVIQSVFGMAGFEGDPLHEN
jgi:hypothetical protein